MIFHFLRIVESIIVCFKWSGAMAPNSFVAYRVRIPLPQIRRPWWKCSYDSSYLLLQSILVATYIKSVAWAVLLTRNRGTQEHMRLAGALGSRFPWILLGFRFPVWGSPGVPKKETNLTSIGFPKATSSVYNTVQIIRFQANLHSETRPPSTRRIYTSMFLGSSEECPCLAG